MCPECICGGKYSTTLQVGACAPRVGVHPAMCFVALSLVDPGLKGTF